MSARRTHSETSGAPVFVGTHPGGRFPLGCDPFSVRHRFCRVLLKYRLGFPFTPILMEDAMIAKLKYGIGQEVSVPVSADSLARMSRQSVDKAIEGLLKEVVDDPDGTAPALRNAVSDPRSVVELKTPEGGYEPLEHGAPIKSVLRGRQSLEIMISRPHAGG